MIKRLSPRLTYANVMATIAVFLAIGGGVTLAAIGGSGSVKFGGHKGLAFDSFDTVLTLPGVGKVQAQCSKGTFVRFKNTSGKTLHVTAHDVADDDFSGEAVPDNGSLQVLSGPDLAETIRFQAFRAGGDGTPAADITVGAKWVASCDQRVITAQAVSSE